MGLYLSEPVRDKTSSSYRDDCGVEAAACTQQGWRTSQEDAHLHVRLDQHTQLFAVFDGHGGPEVRHLPRRGQLGAVRGRMSSLSHTLSDSRSGDSQVALYLATNLPRVLLAAPSYDSQPRAALSEAFLALDDEITSREGSENIARAEALRKAARQQCAVARALDAARAKVRPLLRAAAPAERATTSQRQSDCALSPIAAVGAGRAVALCRRAWR